ncbi:AI-2E family transporter [Parabacteroides sp. PF5-9]|uniref:AI-2E family transporter n=1 Tax=Parabacteroides sp. PF5-9 TaxID=1742404 RepID=UPI00247681E3|nr:AI-2E family transporter [Parabacteroides sp. PF5-9]MDH6356414.1 putative PurR-regulated permease PerM [Parabacteroides sp. PF5-9]
MSIKEQYWRFSLIAIIIGLGVVLFTQITPFLGGILGAFTIYVLVRKQMIFLTEKKKMRPSMAALLLLGETTLFVLIPLSLAAWLIISKLQHFSLDTTIILNTAQHLADIIQEKTGYNVLDKENLLNAVAILPKIGQSLVGSISDLSINLVALIFVLYFMLISCRQMESWFYTILPFSQRNKDRVLKEVYLLVKSNAIGIPLLAVIQGVVALVGYLLFSVPQPLVFGLLTCIATVIPIVGTALVWFPLCVYMTITGDWINAIGLGIYALLVISNIDNLIRFMLQKQMADTHPLITIFGVIIGLSLFGFMGIIFGPILISVFLLCVNIFKEQYLDKKLP